MRDHASVALAHRRRPAQHPRVLEREEAVDARPDGAVRVHLVGAGEPERLEHPRERLGGAQVGVAQLVVVAGVADGGGVAARGGRGRSPSRRRRSPRARPTRPADDRRAQLVAEAPHRIEGEVAEQAVEPVDVRVERLAADPEPRRQPARVSASTPDSSTRSPAAATTASWSSPTCVAMGLHVRRLTPAIDSLTR